MKKFLAAPALIAALALARCASDGSINLPPSPPPAPPSQPAPHPQPPPRPHGDVSLTGTRWHLEQIGGSDVIDDSKASLTISREGRMGGNTSCNSMFGHVTIDGKNISFGQVGSTKMYCGQEGVMAQERRYFDKLKQVATWRIEDDRLYLTNHARKDVLVYEAD